MINRHPYRMQHFAAAVACSLSLCSLAYAGQEPTVNIDGDDITIRGCVGRAPTSVFAAPSALVWSRSNIMLQNVMSTHSGHAAPLGERVFYWIDDEEDLAKHVGQMVEVTGDLDDFEKGEIEIDRDGEFTDIEMKLGGKTEKARVPTAWLGQGQAHDREIDIVSRKIDVDNVKVLGACQGR